MQSAAGEETGEEGGFIQDEEDSEPQGGRDRSAEDEGSSLQPAQEIRSEPDPDDVLLPYLPDADEDPLLATHLVQNIVGEFSNLNTSDDMQDQEPLQEEEEEEEEEFILLDPEHPLVRRQHVALGNQLNKQLEMINLALKEKLATEKADSSHMMETGVDMFRIQEHLARLCTRLDDCHQIKAQAEAKHQQTQDLLAQIKSQFSDLSSQDREVNAKVAQTQAETENVMLQLVFTKGVSDELRSKVKTMKNASHKAWAEKTEAEEQKLKQDLYVDRLTKDLEKLTEQIALYDAQTRAQAEETQAAKEALSEAEIDFEFLLLARKQLLQQWNSSLLGMRKRDEAFAAMQEAMREVEHQVILLDGEIESYKKSTAEEQEENERLTMQLNWSQMDCATSKKLINQKQTQQEALQAHYSTCLRTLRETERTLARLTQETNAYQVQLNDQRRQVEKASAARLDAEDKIMRNMQQKLAHNKSAKYSQQLASKIQTLKKEKFFQLWQLENDMVVVDLEGYNVSQHLESLASTQGGLDKEIAKYNQFLTSNQAKLSSGVTAIGQKEAVIAKCNEKISQIAASTGHEDLSPLQIQAEKTMAEIEETAANIRRHHQLWMKQQGTHVELTLERQAINEDLIKLQTEYTAMEQRKMRQDNQIAAELREEAELDQDVTVLRRDLVKLSTLLSKNGQLSQALEEEEVLMESDVLHTLKEAERESIEILMKCEADQEEKEYLLSCLVEAERQIMLWEKKIQLIKETHSSVDTGQEDIQMLQAEIHRVEVGLEKLLKQQEQLLRESEAVVARRETNVLRRNGMLHGSRKQTTTGDLTLVLQSLQGKIQDTHESVAECERSIRELRGSQASLSDKLAQQRQQLVALCGSGYVLDAEFGALQDSKDRNLAHLVALQSRTKKLQGVREGSYKASSTGETVEAALQSQTERAHAAATVLHRVCEELPQHQEALGGLALALAARTQALDQEA